MKTFLDTNAVILLHRGNRGDISSNALQAFDDAETLHISPMVLLELAFLEEIGRLKHSVSEIRDYLSLVHGVAVDEEGFSFAVGKALSFSWTRDPFDRIITAHAAVFEAPLITKDEKIRTHYPRAVW